MNVEPLSQQVRLLCWGWLCQSQPHHGYAPAYGTTDWQPKRCCPDGTLCLQQLPKSEVHTAPDHRQTSWEFPHSRRGPREGWAANVESPVPMTNWSGGSSLLLPRGFGHTPRSHCICS